MSNDDAFGNSSASYARTWESDVFWPKRSHSRKKSREGHRLSQRLDPRPLRKGTMLVPKRSNSAACRRLAGTCQSGPCKFCSGDPTYILQKQVSAKQMSTLWRNDRIPHETVTSWLPTARVVSRSKGCFLFASRSDARSSSSSQKTIASATSCVCRTIWMRCFVMASS